MAKIAIRVFAVEPAALDAQAAIAVFHRWIQQRSLPGLPIDVADYSHVPAGPGVMLVGHDVAWALDNSQNRLGLLYDERGRGDGEPDYAAVYQRALDAAKKLEAEPEFAGKIAFDPMRFEILWNDRLRYSTWEWVEGDVKAFLALHFGANGYSLTHNSDPRERLRLEIQPV